MATVILDRPQARNAFTLRMSDEIVAALRMAESDPAVRVVILTGAGRDFCVGAICRPEASIWAVMVPANQGGRSLPGECRRPSTPYDSRSSRR